MNTLSNNLFYELELNEQMEMTGGTAVINPITNPIIYRTMEYVASKVAYNIQVSYINSYNDTVTSAGRTDLIKDYPEEPRW